MISTPTLEGYNKLKNEYLAYKTQAEDNIRELNKTIKHFKEAIELLKKENSRLKLDSKDLKKLKEEKLALSKQIMELESEAMLYSNFKNGDSLIFPSFNPSKFSFSIIENSSKQKIKDSLKNKNEEILILKNELMKKDKIISNLQRKELFYPRQDNPYQLNKNSINPSLPFYRTKSESDFLNSSQMKYNKKYFGIIMVPMVQKKNRNSLLSSGKRGTNENIITVNTSSFTKKRSVDMSELNVTMTNEGDEDGHNTLEKNIYSEIKNILEEKRNFILQTMTYENFSFDILAIKPKTKSSSNSINNNNYSQNIKNNKSGINNNIPAFAFSLTKDIDKLLEIIRQRKNIVISEMKNFEEIKDQFGDK